MPTVQTINVGASQPAQALDMRKEYEDMIKITQIMLELFQAQYSDACTNFNRFQGKCVEALSIADAQIASRKGDPVHGELLKRRETFVANFNAMQGKFVTGLGNLERAVSELAEGLHNMLAMVQGRETPKQNQQNLQPNTVQASTPPAVNGQVSEVIEANGQKTIFEDGKPVLVVEAPQPGAVQNGAVVPQGGNGTVIPSS
jgi:hypothetical protein